MAERFVNVFVLNISFGADQTFVQIAFAADMYYPELLQQLRKNTADSLIHGNGTEASSDDQNDR